MVDPPFSGRQSAGIRIGTGPRTPDVEGNESQPQWIVAPLLGAGLAVDDVGTLLLRATFEFLIAGRRCDLSDVSTLLGRQPYAVRAAWVETVDRMLRAGDGAAAP